MIKLKDDIDLQVHLPMSNIPSYIGQKYKYHLSYLHLLRNVRVTYNLFQSIHIKHIKCISFNKIHK